MKKHGMYIVVMILLAFSMAIAQEDVTLVTGSAEGLDLQAVSELFKDAEDLEAFEKALNDPDEGVNNLDLDENGEVDYIRVVEEVVDETHLIILQAPLGEDEFQDVATIEVEKTGDEAYDMQIQGNADIYGPDYYVAPAVVHVQPWPIIRRIYAPAYRPYRSVYRWRHYPRWWKPYKPVTVHVYHNRVVKYHTRRTFVVTKTPRVRTVTRVKYKPRSSTLVVKKKVVRPGGTRVVKKTVKPKPAKGSAQRKVRK